MKKSIQIISLSLVLAILFCTPLLTSCSRQEKFEEAYTLGLQKAIEEFKNENPNIIKSVTYDATFYNMDEVNVVFYIESTEDITNGSYVSLFYPDVDFEKNGISVSVDTYGTVYINGKEKYTNKKSSSSNTDCGHASCKTNGPFYCMGKNDTCPNKTGCAYDYYCDSCD